MNYNWIPWSTQQGMPHNGVHAGNDSDGSPIYVGRAFHDGDQIPAKVIPSKQACYISHNGLEIFKPNFEALTGSGFTWISSSNGHVPAGAVLAGNTVNGLPLYVGRAHHDGSLTPGKIHGAHGCIYIAYNGMEHSILHYEVLVGHQQQPPSHPHFPPQHHPHPPHHPPHHPHPPHHQQRSQWIGSSSHSPAPMGALVAGNDTDGSPIYVGRAFHEGNQLVAKVIPSKQIAYVSHNGQEIPKYSFEVLCNGNVTWVQSSHGQVMSNAIPGGRTTSGEILYIGRGWWQGALTVGKIQPSHQSLYISFNGAEMPLKSYEILIEN